MELFYHPNINENDSYIEFTPEENIHIRKVLRKKNGNHVEVTNGYGLSVIVELSSINSKKTKGNIIKKKKHILKKNLPHIAIAPTKSNSRFEWFLEKATEIGVKQITPIICNNSERRIINLKRYNKILATAIKQSKQYHLPEIESPINIKNFILNNTGGYIAHCNEAPKIRLRDYKEFEDHPIILIGPEGDFSKSEIELAIHNKFISVSLGYQRLRTETAGIYACFSCI